MKPARAGGHYGGDGAESPPGFKGVIHQVALDADDVVGEVSTLIERLHRTSHRLEELTGGEVDAVVDREGRPFLLRKAQEQIRHLEEARQAAILNSLPAHTALLDAQGRIISVNEAWRRFEGGSSLHCPGHPLGVNYPAICESEAGPDSASASKVAAGIRSVLDGKATGVSIECSFRLRNKPRWFLMTATRLVNGQPNGAVVMHLDITERKRAEIGIKRLNRVYAVLSRINTLIVRVRDRDELFKDACRIAVRAGRFRMAWIAISDRGEPLRLVASAGLDAERQDEIEASLLSSRGEGPFGSDVAARVVAERKLRVIDDLKEHVHGDLSPRSQESGIRSVAVLPLIVSGTAKGVLVLCATETEFFHASERKLLTELADDIAFAIDHLEKQDRLNYLAYYDELTGLANRRLFLERVEQHLPGAVGGGYALALFLMDLERFKNINHSLGRSVGDELLRQVAEWMTRRAGDPTLVARVGADHFAALLQVRPDGDLNRLVDKTMEAFAAHPFRSGDSVLRTAVKVGVALFPDDAKDVETLFRNAETALGQAKAHGDRCLRYSPRMTEKGEDTLTLENLLRPALSRNEFVLHYQPKVNLLTRKLVGAEALIRWNDPRTGLVPPGHFIPVLEETGLIHEVGRWALRKAIGDYLRWRNAGLLPVRVAVNVSPRQLRSSSFISEVKEAIAMDEGAAAGLELEITESVIMQDVQHSIATLEAIRALGVTIAIDDFGTGFSSLGYLAKLPLDTLKIDGSFVKDMTGGPQGLALVSTIISMAHALKLKVVAEGVETEEQSRLLRLLDCDEMQGFLFSKPVPAEAFETKFLLSSPAA